MGQPFVAARLADLSARKSTQGIPDRKHLGRYQSPNYPFCYIPDLY